MMRPLSECPTDILRQVSFVLSDIDDTLTDEGRLRASAYGAMAALQDAGFRVIPITGRPAGWCDLIARQWPVDGVVGENGAFYFRYDDEARRMIRVHAMDDQERLAAKDKLALIRDEILAQVPGAAVSAGPPYREADLAIDFCEDVPALPIEDVQRIVALFEKHGATAKVSSIHVNGWFGDHDKLSMTRRFMLDIHGIDLALAEEAARCLFVGDSPNDAPMFGFFANSVGVANIRDFADQCAHKPAYVTHQRGGAGFVELTGRLVGARAR